MNRNSWQACREIPANPDMTITDALVGIQLVGAAKRRFEIRHNITNCKQCTFSFPEPQEDNETLAYCQLCRISTFFQKTVVETSRMPVGSSATSTGVRRSVKKVSA